MNQTNLVRLQQVELAMLEDFVNACGRLKLKYFVIAGTLLGAVRYGGFIPWDDDIDVAMPRDDYERFMQSGQRELKDCYFLQNYVTDPEFPGNYAKLRDIRTTFIETSLKNRKINHGVYIDIFPLDGVPENSIRRRINKFRLTMLQIQIGKYYYRDPGKKGCQSIKGRIAVGLSNIMARGMALGTIQRNIDAIATCSRYADSKYVTNHSGIYRDRERMSREYFGEGTTLTFEGVRVTAPSKWDLYLRSLYSDYMRLPPEEERVAHHGLEKVDLDVPFTHDWEQS